jgi:hypothetical protein
MALTSQPIRMTNGLADGAGRELRRPAGLRLLAVLVLVVV